MRAAMLTEAGVKIQSTPEPAPKTNEVKVRVRACGLNRADLLVASGHAHGRIGGAGTIIGLEFAGDVVEVGADAKGVAVGDRVMCSGGSGWAEYAVADWGRVTRIPDANVSYEQAATLPVALQTMHDAIVTNGQLQAGQAVLIQGASSGVGLMAMKIAKVLGAGLVIGTSTDAGRRAKLTDFGADLAVDSRDAGWVDQVLQATDGAGVDLIVDQLSGYVANDNMRATRLMGRIVNVGRLGGFKGEFDFDLHALRRIQYIGVTFRTRTVEQVREIVRKTYADLGAHVASGALALPIDSVFELNRAADALAHMKANVHFGKIVLRVD